MNSDNIVTKPSSRVKIAVLAPSGKRASPYRIEGQVLVKCVTDRHIFKTKQAVGIDESVWQAHRDRVDIVRFEFPDGSVREIKASEFERKSFLHGDGLSFAKTLFVPLSALKLVRERPPARGQLALFAGGST